MRRLSEENNARRWLRKGLFICVKTAVILCVLVGGALIMGQSSVAPVSVRLLTTYALEYATDTFKPVRRFFPQPYVMEIYKK